VFEPGAAVRPHAGRNGDGIMAVKPIPSVGRKWAADMVTETLTMIKKTLPIPVSYDPPDR
jgi:hypothetical protein